GIFGEELAPIFTLFTPLICVAAYVYLKGPEPIGMVVTLFASLLGTVGLYLSVVAPLSRMLKIAKQCQVCGGRTASDWSSVPTVPEGIQSDLVTGGSDSPAGAPSENADCSPTSRST
ncbi:MAG: hypothetical protein H5T86_02435, partial [Armatimonadetes bacterium]|nr:hypothetical protein [Armatimonadota bacterium]